LLELYAESIRDGSNLADNSEVEIIEFKKPLMLKLAIVSVNGAAAAAAAPISQSESEPAELESEPAELESKQEPFFDSRKRLDEFIKLLRNEQTNLEEIKALLNPFKDQQIVNTLFYWFDMGKTPKDILSYLSDEFDF